MPLSWTGPPAPTLRGIWTAWQLDPLLAGVVLAAATAYLLGLAAARRRGRHWPLRRTIAFFALGLGGLVVTGLGWPAVYAQALFSVYALQVVALLMVIPLLLGLGRPVELAMAALDERGAARLRRALDSRPARLITVPVVSPLLLAVVPFVLFFTPWYPATLQHPALHAASNLLLLVIGLAVLVPLWEAGTIAARIPYAIALLFAFIELLADAVPGIIVRLDTHVIAAAYLTRPWGASLLHDQQLGGDLLWCIGEAIDVPFLALLGVQWYRSDARHAQQVDQALDAAMAVAPDAADAEDAGGELTQPWWEQDASVFGDRAGQYRRRATG
jgi:cytochrome c oxidase assembly factor CtaG